MFLNQQTYKQRKEIQMSTLERQRDYNERNSSGGGGGAGDGGDGVDSLGQNARQFLNEGYDAINRALSDNSEQFLRSSQQSGGE